MKERVFRYGEHNHGIGILTLPENNAGSPIIIMLNAGLLHREEPYRLNVLVARLLAEEGYICLRVDLSGKGDTPPRENLTNRESVSLDWKYISEALYTQFGRRNLIIFGLCSGADNGIKIAANDSSIKGLILLDPISKKDLFFSARHLFNKITNINKFKSLHKIFTKRIKDMLIKNSKFLESSASLRDEPTSVDMDECFNSLTRYNGRALLVFTSHALNHYNKKGQFCKSLNIKGLEKVTEEIFWPQVDHLYTVQEHRDMLIKTINSWCRTNKSIFK